MKKLLFILSVIVSFSFLSCKEEAKSGITNISVEEMQTLLKMDEVQLVDVRTPEEYQEGFIANAQNIDYLSPEFDKKIKKLDKQKPVILYCRSGKRSSKSSKILLKAGFVKIYNLKGGFLKWQEEDMGIIKQ